MLPRPWKVYLSLVAILASSSVEAAKARELRTVVHSKHSLQLKEAQEEAREAEERVARLAATAPHEDGSELLLSQQRAVLWTVVHAKRKDSHLRRDEPKSVLDKVNDFGKEMCKGREDHATCKRFFKDKDEEAESKEEKMEDEQPKVEKAEEPKEEPKAEPQVEEKKEQSPSSAASSSPTTPSTSAKETTSVALQSGSTEHTTAQPDVTRPRLQSQGFRGPLVKHKDHETQTADWHEEYPMTKHEHHKRSGSVGLCSSWTLIGALASLAYIQS
mmetsp:Transcript_11215/g.25576  ORF Transcript_11215/g.25576 Transcript_11215/m.25576 type:complete len:273 (+) Transcript_11215:91-909(+)